MRRKRILLAELEWAAGWVGGAAYPMDGFKASRNLLFLPPNITVCNQQSDNDERNGWMSLWIDG